MSPGIFQPTIWKTYCWGFLSLLCEWMHDSLISGSNDEEHLANLEEVLKRLPEHWLRLKKKKFAFMVNEVVYGMRDNTSWRAFGRWTTEKDWNPVLTASSCEDKFQLFIQGVDCYLPQRTVKVHQTDRPWMTNKLKIWIRKRQTAFQRHDENSSIYKHWSHIIHIKLQNWDRLTPGNSGNK